MKQQDYLCSQEQGAIPIIARCCWGVCCKKYPVLGSTAGEVWILPRFGGIFTPGASKGLGSFIYNIILCLYTDTVCVPLHCHSFHGAVSPWTTAARCLLRHPPCQGPAGHSNAVLVSQPCNCFSVSPGLVSLAYRRIRVDLQHWWGPGQNFPWLQ